MFPVPALSLFFVSLAPPAVLAPVAAGGGYPVVCLHSAPRTPNSALQKCYISAPNPRFFHCGLWTGGCGLKKIS